MVFLRCRSSLVEICIIARRVGKLVRFPWTDSSELGVSLRLLDIFFAYETIERSDETVTEEITVSGNHRRLDDVWGGTEFESLAEHSL
jgi:hypothetical protein